MFILKVNGLLERTFRGTFEQLEHLVEGLLCSGEAERVEVWAVSMDDARACLGTLEVVRAM